MDDRLGSALKSLPRERAGAGFTAGVLQRLDDRRRRPAAAFRDAGRWPLLAAAAVLLLAVGLGLWEGWHWRQRQQATARLASLEQERQVLTAELADLRRQVAGAQPMVYLGGSNDLDLVLDLAEVRRNRVRPTDIPAGLLRAYRLSQADRPAAVGAGELPAYAGPAAGGIRPARLDDRRPRTVY